MTNSQTRPAEKDFIHSVGQIREEITNLETKLLKSHNNYKALSELFEDVIIELGSHDLEKLKTFLEERDKPIVFDCGGYDGCSAILLKLLYPNHDCVTFEPNPALWSYYEEIDTFLVRAAISNFDGKSSILIDEVDGDGSTLERESKPVYFKQKVEANDSAASMPIMCANLINILEKAYACRSGVILKLDVEGAEYEILDSIIKHNTNLLSNLGSLFCEFHNHKMTGNNEWRSEIERLTNDLRPVEPWDSTPLSVINKKEKNILLRSHLIKAINEATDAQQ